MVARFLNRFSIIVLSIDSIYLKLYLYKIFRGALFCAPSKDRIFSVSNIISFILYRMNMKGIANRIRKKRAGIEYELPRFVFKIEKSLMHDKDVLGMIESFARNAGPELKHELDITAADMRSGNTEIAITRLEARVGSPLMSDVCRGLISIDRGDVNTVYWKSLSMKFADIQRQQLRLEAQKIPKKVKWLSMCLLFCFMLIYIVVILAQIMNSVGVLFG